MESKGIDMGDYQEAYKGYGLEVAVEQAMTGVKSHYRVLKGEEVMIDWRAVHIDGFWLTEQTVMDAAFEAARGAVDREL
jgi:hypothetical protein